MTDKKKMKQVSERRQDAGFKNGYVFHPFEVAVCGYAKSGKTTLITKVIEYLNGEFDIGYIKHGVKKFEIDTEGKDTQTAWSRGASRILISDTDHTACIHRGTPSPVELWSSFLDCDFVIIEGQKSAPIDKIVVIDKERKILEFQTIRGLQNIIGLVGEGSIISDSDLQAPYFQRDDVSGIAGFIVEHIRASATEVPLYGLVLAGGKSTRMNSDKALLDYYGKPQAKVVYELLRGVCENVYISSHAGQWSEGGLNDLPQIHDIFHALGPLSGILSAMHTHPNVAWLVVACDLPFIKGGTLAKLISSRDLLKMATCFKSTRDQMPEPLCAIYEPKIRARLFEYLAMGNVSPRDVLTNSPICLIDQTDDENLENVNYTDEYIKAKTEIIGGEER